MTIFLTVVVTFVLTFVSIRGLRVLHDYLSRRDMSRHNCKCCGHGISCPTSNHETEVKD